MTPDESFCGKQEIKVKDFLKNDHRATLLRVSRYSCTNLSENNTTGKPSEMYMRAILHRSSGYKSLVCGNIYNKTSLPNRERPIFTARHTGIIGFRFDSFHRRNALQNKDKVECVVINNKHIPSVYYYYHFCKP